MTCTAMPGRRCEPGTDSSRVLTIMMLVFSFNGALGNFEHSQLQIAMRGGSLSFEALIPRNIISIKCALPAELWERYAHLVKDIVMVG